MKMCFNLEFHLWKINFFQIHNIIEGNSVLFWWFCNFSSAGEFEQGNWYKNAAYDYTLVCQISTHYSYSCSRASHIFRFLALSFRSSFWICKPELTFYCFLLISKSIHTLIQHVWKWIFSIFQIFLNMNKQNNIVLVKLIE